MIKKTKACLLQNLFLIFTLISSLVRAVEKLFDLTISEGFRNPIGFHDQNPRFSWKLLQEGSVKSQLAYRFVVSTSPDQPHKNPDLWDSKKVLSDDSTFISYNGEPLDSRIRAYWQV